MIQQGQIDVGQWKEATLRNENRRGNYPKCQTVGRLLAIKEGLERISMIVIPEETS